MQNLFQRVNDSQVAFERAYSTQAHFARQDIASRQYILDEADLRIRSYEEVRTRELYALRDDLLRELQDSVDQNVVYQQDLIDVSRDRLKYLMERAYRLRETLKQEFAKQDKIVAEKSSQRLAAVQQLRDRAYQLAIREEYLGRKRNEEFYQYLLGKLAEHDKTVAYIDTQFMQLKNDLDAAIESRGRDIRTAGKQLSQLARMCSQEVGAVIRERKHNEQALTRHLQLIIDRIEAAELQFQSMM